MIKISTHMFVTILIRNSHTQYYVETQKKKELRRSSEIRGVKKKTTYI